MMHHLRGIRLFSLTIAAFLMILPAADIAAQGHGRSTMVSDDGSGPRVMHFAMPDFSFALTPDYLLSDLPIFKEELALTDVQSDILHALIEDYTAEFQLLKSELAPDIETEKPDRKMRGPGERGPDANRQRTGGRGGGRGGPGSGGGGGMDVLPIQDLVMDALRDAGIPVDSYDEMPYKPEIGVGIEIQDTGSGPEPSFNVSVDFPTDDDSLSDELRSKLQAAAERLVPLITAMVKEQMADRLQMQMQGGPGDEDGFERRWKELETDRARIEQILAAKNALKEKFETEVKSTLEEAQKNRWQEFVKTITRVKTLPLGTLDGEKTDLAAILKQIADDSDLNATLEETLNQYKEQLHNALVRRNNLLQTSDFEIDRAFYEGKLRQALNAVDQITDARTAIRRITDTFINQINEQLETTLSDDFLNKALIRSYPRVYDEAVGTRALDLASNLPELTQEQQKTIASLTEAHSNELDSVNGRIYLALRKVQENQLRQMIDRAIAIVEDRDPNPDYARDENDLTEGFRSRQHLDVRYMKQLYDLLSADQVARLPRIPKVDVAAPVGAEGGEDFSAEDDR